jgi:hypothetical protein
LCIHDVRISPSDTFRLRKKSGTRQRKKEKNNYGLLYIRREEKQMFLYLVNKLTRRKKQEQIFYPIEIGSQTGKRTTRIGHKFYFCYFIDIFTSVVSIKKFDR